MDMVPNLNPSGPSSPCSSNYIDEEKLLAQKAMSGNIAAFTILVQTYQGLVYRLCRRYLQTADAEDAAQETFIRALVHQKSFNPDLPIGPWLTTIARRICIDLRRKNSIRQNDKPVSWDRSHSGEGENALVFREEYRRFANGLNDLPENQREALILFYWEGMSYAEIATALEVPIGTIMTWLHRGKAKLLALIEANT
jgi:RNA polymerase sigma-70 factor (ECF subfamily)